MRISFIFVCIDIFFAVNLVGQVVNIPQVSKSVQVRGLNPAKPLTQYVLDSWKTQQGLPQNSALALCQTRDGYLWIGTQEGAARFDGVQFKIFDKEMTPGLGVSYTISLCEQRDGTLWMGTRGGGLVRYRYGQADEYMIFDSTKGLNATDIWCIIEDRAGTLWIGTDNGLFAYTDRHFRRFTTREGLPHLIVYALHQDRMGKLWVGTQKGLCRLDGFLADPAETARKIFTQENLPNDTSDVHAILHDSKGTLHFGSRSGLWSRPSGGQWKLRTQKDGLSGNYVYAMMEDRNGSIWLALYDNGISRIIGNRIEVFDRKDGLANENTLALLEDREGAIWVGTDGGGVQRFTNGSCINMTTREGLAGNVVRSFCQDSTGGIWIATSSTGLHCLRDGKVTLYDKTRTHVFVGNEIRGLLTDSEGAVWVGILGAGVYYYKDGRWGHYSTKDGLVSNDVNTIVRDREGAIWFGCSQNGISRFKNGRYTSLGKREGLMNESVYGLLPDSAGGLWIGSFGGGAQYYRDGRFTNYSVANGLMSNSILGFYQDASGAVWVAGVGGISRIKNGIVSSLTKKEGLYDDVSFTIVEDNHGYFWATCNKGIYRFRRSEADSVADGFLKRLRCQNFGTADGMRSAECNGGAQPSALKARDGRLWFSTIEGVVIIDPLRIETNPLPPSVIIESVFVDSLSLNLEERCVIGASTSRVQFNYTATSLISAERVRFRYLLEGFDKEWTEAGTRRTAYYTNLPRGRDYRFRVIACNNDGVWNDVGSSVAFSTQSFWWETWWFYGLCLLIVSGGGYEGFRWRTRRLRSKAEELECMVENRTTEVQSQAQQIQLKNTELQESLETLRRTQTQLAQAEKMASLGTLVAGVAHELNTPIGVAVTAASTLHGRTKAFAERYKEGGLKKSELEGYIETAEIGADLTLRNLERAANLIQSFKQVAVDQTSDQKRRFNLHQYVQGVITSLEPKWKTTNHRVEIDCDETIELETYPGAIAQIITNLIDNSLLHGFQGYTESGVMRIVAEKDNDRITLTYSDNGRGIPVEVLPRIFDPFFTTKQAQGGTGLGMHIVFNLVTQKLGGEIRCESGENRGGTTFTLTFPVQGS